MASGNGDGQWRGKGGGVYVRARVYACVCVCLVVWFKGDLSCRGCDLSPEEHEHELSP